MNGSAACWVRLTTGHGQRHMPQALGASATAPGRQVIAMCGDGGFSMLMGDFLGGTDEAADKNRRL